MNKTHALDPLTRAAIRHGSDKFGGHLYTPIYHDLFKKRRNLSISMLEIGVGGYNSPESGGASLKMWAEYFPYAKIVGLDIEPKRLDVSPRVNIIQGSQIDIDVLESLVQSYGPFDIIIDDGSHIVSHMMTSFEFLYPLMSPSGIYIIEDIQTSFLDSAGGTKTGAETVFSMANRISLAMHKKEGYQPENSSPYDKFGSITKSVSIFRNQVVFHRGSNTYPSNHAMDFEDFEVHEIFQTIETEAASNPSTGSFLCRIDMAIWSGRHDEAGKLALKASRTFPSDIPLHYELVRMMEWAGQNQARLTVNRQLDSLRSTGKVNVT
jgi:hypothetical protein